MAFRTLIVCLVCWLSAASGQEKIPPADMRLQPYRMAGQDNTLRRNLTFGEYKTQKLRRTLGSYFSFNPPSLVNILRVGDVPLIKKDKLRAKDVFRFDLEKNGKLVSSIECRAILRKNETFRLLRKQDSSFFGALNKDFMDARIRLASDTAQVWSLAASNLNGSKDEDQRGIIRKGDLEITFVKTTLLLRDRPVSDKNPISLLASINMVYAFKVDDEIVAAVSFKDSDRRFWINEDLNEQVRDVIAAAASLLTIRRDIYQ